MTSCNGGAKQFVGVNFLYFENWTFEQRSVPHSLHSKANAECAISDIRVACLMLAGTDVK